MLQSLTSTHSLKKLQDIRLDNEFNLTCKMYIKVIGKYSLEDFNSSHTEAIYQC